MFLTDEKCGDVVYDKTYVSWGTIKTLVITFIFYILYPAVILFCINLILVDFVLYLFPQLSDSCIQFSLMNI